MKNKFNSGLIVLILLVVFGILFTLNKITKTTNIIRKAPAVTTERSTNYDPDIAKTYKKNFIAAVYLEGTISEENATYNHKWMMKTINDLKNNPNNEAIALYINSPGGAVYQADEVYLALMDYKIKTNRPIYVYQGPMAASGGYYISCAGNEIYANRNTLTGCIGVLMGTAFDLTGLFEELGIEATTVHSGRNKNMMNYNEPFTEEQQEIMQSMCDECYEQFVTIVARSRHISYDKAEELSDGRLYTAKQALENGLIDKIDTWNYMLEDLSNKIEKPGIRVVTYQKEKKKNTMLDLLTGKAKDIATATASAKLGLPEKVINDINNNSMMPMYLATGF